MNYISVVICTFNKKERLLITLKSYENIYKTVYKNFEVIICNDGGEDIAEFIQMYRFSYPIKYLNIPHLGRAAARNYGAHLAGGSVIMFNDDDILINPECFKFHVEIHNDVENSVVLGKYKQIYLTEAEIKNHVENEFHLEKYSSNAKEDIHEIYTKNIIFKKKQSSRHWICGATGNLSLSKDSFIKSGGLDTNFQGWGYEDIEFSYRLYKNNMSFYCNIYHSNYHLDHYRNKKNMIEDIKRNILYFYNKHGKAKDISLYWDFLRGYISLNELDKNTLNEFKGSMKKEIIYPGLMRSKLSGLELFE